MRIAAEVFTAFLACVGMVGAITHGLRLLFRPEERSGTYLYIPFQDETEEDALRKIESGTLRGKVVVVCVTEKGKDKTIEQLAERYGRVYKRK